ncbi:pimeloyl-ACP methyl ester carboxylesterase [Bradyrhizobium elkanii]
MKYFVARGEDRRLDASARAGLRGSFVELLDGVTHYELSGPLSGDVVILAGGLTIPLFYWDHFVRELHAAGFRTLAYSGYGRGYSERLRKPYDDALFVRQIAGLVRALALGGRHHVIGSSMGALVAMGYLVEHSASVATLTVAGPAGLGNMPAALRLLQSAEPLARFVARRFGRRWLDNHQAHNLGDRTHAADLSAMVHDAYRYEGSLHALFDTLLHFGLFGRAELYRRVGDLALPKLLIWGREDQVTPIDKLDAARALLRPERCHVLACGHMTPFERPSEVAELFTSFVSAHRGPV